MKIELQIRRYRQINRNLGRRKTVSPDYWTDYSGGPRRHDIFVVSSTSPHQIVAFKSRTISPRINLSWVVQVGPLKCVYCPPLFSPASFSFCVMLKSPTRVKEVNRKSDSGGWSLVLKPWILEEVRGLEARSLDPEKDETSRLGFLFGHNERISTALFGHSVYFFPLLAEQNWKVETT